MNAMDQSRDNFLLPKFGATSYNMNYEAMQSLPDIHRGKKRLSRAGSLAIWLTGQRRQGCLTPPQASPRAQPPQNPAHRANLAARRGRSYAEDAREQPVRVAGGRLKAHRPRSKGLEAPPATLHRVSSCHQESALGAVRLLPAGWRAKPCIGACLRPANNSPRSFEPCTDRTMLNCNLIDPGFPG